MMKEGWTYKKLGEVAHYPTKRVSSELMNETNYVGVDNLVKDRGGKTLANYVPSEGSAIEYRKGDVLLGNIRPYLKKIWLSDIDGGASGDVLIIRPNNTKKLWSNYLYWVLASDHFFEYDTLHCKGAKMPRGNKDDIMNYPVPVPPFEVQKQIASEFVLLSETIEKQKAQIEELDKLAQSIFYDMFGDPVTNEKGWEKENLRNNVVEMFLGPFGSSLKVDSYVPCEESYCMVYEQKHAIQKTLDLESHYISEEKYESLKRFEVKPGDFIMSCRGTIGKLFRLPPNAPIGIIHPSLMKIRVKEDAYNPIFFIFMLPKIIENETTNGNCVQMAITAKALGEKALGIPPLTLQQEFAAKVEQIESMKAKVRQSLTEAETLFNSRMDYYFN